MYDPEFYLARETFIRTIREQIADSTNADNNEILNVLITLYEELTDLFREYDGVYEDRDIEKLNKKIDRKIKYIKKIIRLIKTTMKGE